MLLLWQFSMANNEISPEYKFHDSNSQISIDDETPKSKWDKAIGSFQFEIIKGRKMTEINVKIIDEIESKRHETDIVYITYSDNIRIKILPKSMIDTDFDKLELMTYVESFTSNI